MMGDLTSAARRLEGSVARLDGMVEAAPEAEWEAAYLAYTAELRAFGALLRQTTGLGPLQLAEAIAP